MSTTAYTEPELLAAVAAGDETAFRNLFARWQPFLATHIFRITRSRELTEEIVQDVFLKIWQGRESLEEVQHFKAYLLVVSRNHAFNALSKVAREYRHREQWAREQEPEGEDPRQLYFSLIDEAVEQLSPRQQEVYRLSRQERLTYKEVADRLGIGRESVKTHLENATKAIKAHVREQLGLLVLLFLKNL